MNKKEIQHLYWRAGFGINPKHLEFLSSKTRKEVVADLFFQSKEYAPLLIDTSDFDTLTYEQFTKSKKIQRAYIKNSRDKIKELNHAWVDAILYSDSVLREKMTLFWANHFACQDKMIMYVQKYNNTLREHALGNFRDFVKAISREPSMIEYLDLKQNKKDTPNENFARELMELFTLGVGNYTEKDIKESAKAFTGYNYDFEGSFEFNDNQHNNEFKYVFGKAGRYDGDDIIDIILDQKTSAEFICKKLYRYFVNNQINQSHIDEMTQVFYPNYNIESVLHFMFSQDWFYSEEHIGNKIKSPIELIAGISQVTPLSFKNTDQLIRIERMLGQILFYPPNVAGWKGGKNWIDSNTLMLRLKLPSILLSNAKIATNKKGEFYDSFNAYKKGKATNTQFKTSSNWLAFKSNYQNVSTKELPQYILQCSINKGTQDYLETLSINNKQDYCVQLMSLPEYQMC
ncbi:DUF1800 domain-containing protein [Xanthomarina sp. F2636L]|uniref:DUF1800 domain-containing protein n=1 Tax=Xanthomarina sp. F2636L TaxID=2996018 RepID=UPI00225DF9E9|nr:DUF1800 domain-containing protein [Xanthomarina sp. F2636L]MCX7551192.1 DUF1800 domain-containing protein [Xanthomarina sp. F2636L]